MSPVILNIKELIGTSNAIIQKLGNQVFDVSFPYLSNGIVVVLDFSGIDNLTSGFCNASIGQLYTSFPVIAPSHVVVANITQSSIWQEKITEAIVLATNPAKAQQIDDAILALFE